jgi:hypothetical protein
MRRPWPFVSRLASMRFTIASVQRAVALAILGALVVVAAPTSVSAAGKPVREFLPAPEFIEFAPGDLCEFGVRIDVLVNQEYGTTFTDDAGVPLRTIVTGRLVLKVTNLSDPSKSLVVNASGPGLVVYEGDLIRVTLRGRSLVFLPGEEPLLFLNSGQVVELGNGTIQPVVLPVISQVGHRVDYCPLLA